MKDKKLSRVVRVADEPAARIFSRSRMRRLLMQFVRSPRSIADVAKSTQMDLKQAHYCVRRLYDLGLLTVAYSTPRGGRAIKYYRAVGDSFFVPDSLMPEPSTEGLAREIRERLNNVRDEGGLLMELGPGGEPRATVLGRPSRDPNFELWRILRLSSADLAQLQEALQNVLCTFQNRPSPKSGKTFLVHCAGVVRADTTGHADNLGV